MDVNTIILAVPIAAYYSYSGHWLLNNFFGILFSVIGIQSLNLPSFKIAFLLLWGLFFYDIFWVYGTDVMLTVAKSVDAPIKLVFPTHIPHPKTGNPQFSMLGLGDIVIPGIFIALCVRYDINRILEKKPVSKQSSSASRPDSNSSTTEANPTRKIKPLTVSEVAQIRTPYFNWAMVSYGIGIIITFAVMIFSGHAQPALLFLVPCVCASVLIVSFFEGDFTNLFAYDETVTQELEK